MKLIFKYILNQFLGTHLSIFLVLFGIVSMVFFIQIANLTSSIEISFLDLFKLYGFMLPRILIFTLPLAFFVALTLALYRLSKENESVVFFTLGFTPLKMAQFFLKIATFLSVLMLGVALVMIPIVYQLQKNFVDYKKTQIKFNYKTGEFGQKFLDWMIFIQDEKEGGYENIIMYHPKSTDNLKEQLIIAKEANLERSNEGFAFRLSAGKMYNFDADEALFIGEFENLVVNTKFSDNLGQTKAFYEYWDDINTNADKAREFVMYVCISLFPLVSTLFALSFGIVTYRYEKGFIYLGMFGVIAVYFGLLSSLYKPPLLMSFLIFSFAFAASIICFKKMIMSRY
ncbi:LptF/LptG family permease [Campylobacter upsaliensis]|nr:LptF/LptG family permease [Campylobacter upsaliensis]